MTQANTTSSNSMRRPRNSLSRVEILNAAERVGQRVGGDLTIREIAGALGASPMSIYRYFDSREELISNLLDRIMSRFEYPTRTGDLQADLANFARSHKRLLDAHPWAISLFFTHPAPGPATDRIGETALSMLVGGGLSREMAVSVFSAVIALNYGWASFAKARSESVINGTPGLSLADSLSLLSDDEFPVTRQVAHELVEYGAHRHYELALGVLVTGLRTV